MKSLILCLIVGLVAHANPESSALSESSIVYEVNHNFDITNGGIIYGYWPTVFYPKNTSEVQKIVQLARRFNRKVRAIGSLHSLNPCGVCKDYVVSLDRMDRILEVRDGRVVVEAGIIIRDLCTHLEDYGLTLEAIGSIAEQTISGAISTGTHGQVPYAGSLASQVIGLEIVDGNGIVHHLERNSEELLCSASSLGMMGIITKVTLQCTPLFLMVEIIRHMEMQEVLDNLDAMLAYDKLVMYWNIDKEEVKVISGHRINCDFIPLGTANFKTLGNYPHMHIEKGLPDTLQRVGKSWEINTIFSWSNEEHRSLIANMKKKRKGVFQGEYSIPIEQLSEAVKEVREFFRANKHRLHLTNDQMIVEIRPVKRDKVWLSPSYNRDSISLGFHSFEGPLKWTLNDASEFIEWETIIKEHFDARPHLGKCHFFSDSDLEWAFPKWSEFKERRKKADPCDIFLTDYLRGLLGY